MSFAINTIFIWRLNILHMHAYRLFIFFSVLILNANAQYCIPTSTYGTTDNDYIDGVELNTLSNLGTGGGDGSGYTDFTYLSTELYQGTTYTITITNTPSYSEHYRAWIDYNQNEIFESSEELFLPFTLTAGSVGSADFTVPAGAMPGETFMRVRCVYATDDFDACSDETYSEAEDYKIIIVGFDHDLAVTNIILPPADCDLGVNETITATIKNWGLNNESGFNIKFRVDGGAVISELFPSTINAGESTDFTFTAEADLSADGTHFIDAWTSLATDEYPENDSSENSVENLFTILTTGFPASVCYGGETILPSPLAGGGTWSGDGIINSSTGELDPSLIGGVGGTTDITYSFSPTSAYTVTQIPFYPAILISPAEVVLGDDEVLDNIPIGFSFQFFGNNYSDLFISSNGIVGFDAGDNAYEVQHIPDITEPNNLIAFCFTDLNPGDGGTISYELQGLAPERRFIIYYDHVRHYLGPETITGEIILYETSNAIDLISMDIESDGGNMTQGIENADGTVSYLGDEAYNESVFSLSGTTWRYAVTPCSATVTETINIIEAPEVDLGDDASYCDGEIVILDAGPGAEYYGWNTGDVTEIIYPEITGTYWVVYNVSPSCYAVDSINLVFNPNPVVDLGDDATVCEGSILNAENPDEDYIWSTGETTQTINVTETDTYWVLVTNPLTGCDGSDTVNYIVMNLPVADFIYSYADALTVNFASTTTDAETFFWDFGDGATSFEENPIHTYPYAGAWNVTLTVTNTCGADISDAPVTIQVDVNDISEINSFNLYPNPANDFINIDFYSSEINKLIIYNLFGEIIYSSEINSVQKINVRNWADGNYFAEINSEGKRSIQYFAVQH